MDGNRVAIYSVISTLLGCEYVELVEQRVKPNGGVGGGAPLGLGVGLTNG